MCALPVYLLARDRHVVADVREQRRLDEIAYLDAIGAPGAAGLQRGAFLDPLGDQPLHLLPLRLVDERPDMPALRHRIADLGRLHHLLRDRDRLVLLALVDQPPRRTAADLASIAQPPPPPGRGRLAEKTG